MGGVNQFSIVHRLRCFACLLLGVGLGCLALAGTKAATAEAPRRLTLENAGSFWAFQPVKSAPVPAVKDAAWPRSSVDRFVLAKLQEQRLKPVPDADPRTLIRRLHHDLTGLPPTPEEVEAFARDCGAGAQDSAFRVPHSALAPLVDRLLASPHFGERWGRHWLDLARYAESNGKARNMTWHHAWRYRDWVIGAFNRDLPYDQFIREQVAGDLLPGSGAERDARIVATGFLALGAKALEETKRELFRMDVIDEQIEVIGRAFLGLSIACARCHDHKFDPVPTRDYYALAGILRSTQPLYGRGPMGIKCVNDSDLQPIGTDAPALAPKAAEHLQDLATRVQERNDARSSRYRIVRNVADAKTQLKKPGADAVKIEADIAKMEAVIKEWDAKIKTLETTVLNLETNFPPQPAFALAAREAAKPEDSRIHIRGTIENLGEVVPRGLPQVIQVPGLAPIAPRESGRRQLADWLAHPANPLTARVAVNRVWQHLFGRGLVSTPDDFGLNGARPSHPELLDHLAAQFVADGWSTKKLIRSLVLSRVYQLGSAVDAANQERDPDNVFLWRKRPRALEAEVFHDAVLAVSGQLDPRPRAGSMVADLPLFKAHELFSFNPQLVETQMVHAHRAVYLPVVRGVLPEVLKLFDFAEPSMALGARDETVVPAQASFLMNSPWLLAQARHLASAVLAGASAGDAEPLERLFRRVLSRPPTAAERERFLNYLTQPEPLSPAPKSPPTAEQARLEQWTSLAQVLLASAEFRFSF